jgi:hypothetical protein
MERSHPQKRREELQVERRWAVNPHPEIWGLISATLFL